MPPATDPLVPNLVLQVHLGLAVAVGRLVLLKHQSKERLQTQLEGSTVRKAAVPEGRKKGHRVKCQLAVPCECRECQLRFGLPK